MNRGEEISENPSSGSSMEDSLGKASEEVAESEPNKSNPEASEKIWVEEKYENSNFGCSMEGNSGKADEDIAESKTKKSNAKAPEKDWDEEMSENPSSGCSMEGRLGKHSEEVAESETKKSISEAPEMEQEEETSTNSNHMMFQFLDKVPPPNNTLTNEENNDKFLPSNDSEEDGARIFCSESFASIDTQANTNVFKVAGLDEAPRSKNDMNSATNIMGENIESLKEVSIEGYDREENGTNIDGENIFSSSITQVENYYEDHMSILAEPEARNNMVIQSEDLENTLRNNSEMNHNTETSRSLQEVQVLDQSLPRTVEENENPTPQKVKSHKRYDQEDNDNPRSTNRDLHESKEVIIFEEKVKIKAMEPHSDNISSTPKMNVKEVIGNESEWKKIESIDDEVSSASLCNNSPKTTFNQNSVPPERNIQEDIQSDRRNSTSMLFFDPKNDSAINEGQVRNINSENLLETSNLEVDMKEHTDRFGDANYNVIDHKPVKEMTAINNKVDTQILVQKPKENDGKNTQNPSKSTILNQGPIKVLSNLRILDIGNNAASDKEAIEINGPKSGNFLSHDSLKDIQVEENAKYELQEWNSQIIDCDSGQNKNVSSNVFHQIPAIAEIKNETNAEYSRCLHEINGPYERSTKAETKEHHSKVGLKVEITPCDYASMMPTLPHDTTTHFNNHNCTFEGIKKSNEIQSEFEEFNGGTNKGKNLMPQSLPIDYSENVNLELDKQKSRERYSLRVNITPSSTSRISSLVFIESEKNVSCQKKSGTNDPQSDDILLHNIMTLPDNQVQICSLEEIENNIPIHEGETPHATKILILPNIGSSIVSESPASGSLKICIQEEYDFEVGTDENFRNMEILEAEMDILYEKTPARNNVNLLSHEIKEVVVEDVDTKLPESEFTDNSRLIECKNDNDVKNKRSLHHIKYVDECHIYKEKMAEEHDSKVEFMMDTNTCQYAEKGTNHLYDVDTSSNDQIDTGSLQDTNGSNRDHSNEPNECNGAENKGTICKPTMLQNSLCNYSCMNSDAQKIESTKVDTHLKNCESPSSRNQIIRKMISFELEGDIGLEETRETNVTRAKNSQSISIKEEDMKEAVNNALEEGKIECIEHDIIGSWMVNNENMNPIIRGSIEMENEKEDADNRSLPGKQMLGHDPNVTITGASKVESNREKLKTEITTPNDKTNVCCTFYSHNQSVAQSIGDKWSNNDRTNVHNTTASNKKEFPDGHKKDCSESDDSIFSIWSNNNFENENSQKDGKVGFHCVKGESWIGEVSQSIPNILHHRSLSHLYPRKSDHLEGNGAFENKTDNSSLYVEETVEDDYPKSDLLRYTFPKENNENDAESEAGIHKPKYFEFQRSEKMTTREDTHSPKYQLCFDDSENKFRNRTVEIQELNKMVHDIDEDDDTEVNANSTCNEVKFSPQEEFAKCSNDLPDGCIIADKEKPEKDDVKQSCYLSDGGDGLIDLRHVKNDDAKDDTLIDVLQIRNEHETREKCHAMTFEHLGKIIRITGIETKSGQSLPEIIRKLKESTSMKQNGFNESMEKLKMPGREVKNLLPAQPDPESYRVALSHQEIDERKRAERWMIDYALRQIIAKLAPARKRKVAMLVEAFEAVTPLPANI